LQVAVTKPILLQVLHVGPQQQKKELTEVTGHEQTIAALIGPKADPVCVCVCDLKR